MSVIYPSMFEVASSWDDLYVHYYIAEGDDKLQAAYEAAERTAIDRSEHCACGLNSCDRSVERWFSVANRLRAEIERRKGL